MSEVENWARRQNEQHDRTVRADKWASKLTGISFAVVASTVVARKGYLIVKEIVRENARVKRERGPVKKSAKEKVWCFITGKE